MDSPSVKEDAVLFFSDCAVSASLVVTPLFAKALGASNFEIGLISAIYGLAMLVSSYIAGWASDVFGRGRLLKASLPLAAVIFPLQAFSPSPLHFLALRGISGIFAGMYPPILAVQGYEARGRLGRLLSFGALGWGVGSLIISFVSLYREVFLASGILFLAAFIVSLKMDVKEVFLKIPFFPEGCDKAGDGGLRAVLPEAYGSERCLGGFSPFLGGGRSKRLLDRGDIRLKHICPVLYNAAHR